MRFKKVLIVVMMILGIIIFMNQYKKQNVFTLIDQHREVSSWVEVLFFNNFMPDNLPCSVLTGIEARNLLHKIKYESFRANDGILHPNNRLHGITGDIVVIPEWMDFLPYEWMPYLRKCVYSLYDPWCQLLYLSEDCSELGWDYIEGFCISNVPPSMLGIDMEKIERHFIQLGIYQDSTSSVHEKVSNEIAE